MAWDRRPPQCAQVHLLPANQSSVPRQRLCPIRSSWPARRRRSTMNPPGVAIAVITQAAVREVVSVLCPCRKANPGVSSDPGQCFSGYESAELTAERRCRTCSVLLRAARPGPWTVPALAGCYIANEPTADQLVGLTDAGKRSSGQPPTPALLPELPQPAAEVPEALHSPTALGPLE